MADGVQFEAVDTLFTSGVTSLSIPFTVGAYNNRLLLISGMDTDGAVLSATVDGASTGITQIATQTGTFGRETAWYLVAPAAGSHTMAVSKAGGADIMGMTVRTYYNVNQASPIASSQSQAASSAANISLPAVLTGNIRDLCVDFVVWSTGNGVATDGQTERLNTGAQGGSDLLFTSTGTDMTWTFDSSPNAILIGAVLQPAQDITPDRTMPMQYFQSWS